MRRVNKHLLEKYFFPAINDRRLSDIYFYVR